MQLRKRIMHLFQPKVLVLMYHRIANLQRDPWQLGVSPENFEQHLRVLKKTGKLIPVKELVSSLHKKTLSPGSICLTFDDGYCDNYLSAIPLLEKYQSPATFFIPSKYINQQRQFWWDELESMLLGYKELPRTISYTINGKVFRFDLESDDILTDLQIKEQDRWTWPGKPPTRRCELYLQIWEQLRPLPLIELESVLEEIKGWASFKEPSVTSDFPMSAHQLRETVDHPFIELGLHTVTHPALSDHSVETQLEEIFNNKKYLENLSGKPLETIAYPYGNYNDLTLSVVKQLGLRAAFTTTAKIVSNLTDPYQVGRFQVRNWNGVEFERWLFNWKKSTQFL